MEYLADVGEYIPYAKKETATPKEEVYSKSDDAKGALTLKSLWPEPDWIANHLDGIPVTVLAAIYSIYHSLSKKPHTTERFSFSGVRVTAKMWEQAYIEAVIYIRQACENATTNACIDELEAAFNERFNVGGKSTYKTYAAGTRTPKTFYHPLAGRGSAGEFKKLLPLLDWPLSVKANKIPLVPIKLRHRETEAISYSLGKVNKKTVSWSTAANGYKNEFDSYQEAVNALIEHHGNDFKIENTTQSAVDVYIPKKDVSKMRGVDDAVHDITPEELMTTYGFRGIQFGNYMPQKERQTYVNNTFHSLDLLANILNMPKRWIGGGRLGLAFGARGHGFAAAHYELEQHVINLTRFNGPGSIAHEVFHAFDARMAKRWFDRDALLSNLITSNEVAIGDIEAKYRDRFVAFTQLTMVCTEPSSFTKNAERIESQKGAAKYWSKPSELCARAFEAFIQDKLEEQNIKKQWLALGTLESDYARSEMHPYPNGDFRERLHSVLSEVIPVIFTQQSGQ